MSRLSLIALFAFAGYAQADDAARARAALALAAATESAPPAAVLDADGRTPIQAARAALAEALGAECDCGVCSPAKQMPASVAHSVMPSKPTAETLADYQALAAKVKALTLGESLRVFAGVEPIEDTAYTGVAYHLAGAIPGNAPGVWRCWVDPKTGTATMQQLHLTSVKK